MARIAILALSRVEAERTNYVYENTYFRSKYRERVIDRDAGGLGMVVLQQMVVLFLIMLVGFVAYKKQMITDEVSRKLSAIVVNIANPAMIFYGVMGDNSGISKGTLLETVVVATVMYVGMTGIALLLPAVLRVRKNSVGVYRAMTLFGNVGFMGFPIISSIYGSGALLYASVFLIPYNLLVYTVGINFMQKGDNRTHSYDAENACEAETDCDDNYGKPENTSDGAMSRSWRRRFKSLEKIFNIGVISTLLSMVVYLLNVRFPDWIVSGVGMLSNMTAPLSMMIIGAGMATLNLKKLFLDTQMLVFSFFKLLVIPVVGTMIASRLIGNEVLAGVTMIMLSVPVGSMTSMLAQEFDGDYEMATKGVTITTVLSVITIPLVAAIAA